MKLKSEQATTLVDHDLLLFRNITPILLVITWIIAAYNLLQGHNIPGGGFISGLMISIIYLFKYKYAKIKFDLSFSEHLITVGILVAITSSSIPIIFNLGAFFQNFTFFKLPLALMFDISVFLVVVGASLNFIRNLE